MKISTVAGLVLFFTSVVAFSVPLIPDAPSPNDCDRGAPMPTDRGMQMPMKPPLPPVFNFSLQTTDVKSSLDALVKNMPTMDNDKKYELHVEVRERPINPELIK